jgi:predicted acyltransferase
MDKQQHINAIKTSTRLVSLDALRGFDMFWIVCGEYIFHGIANGIMTTHSLTRNPVDWQIATSNDLSVWESIAIGISNQLHHTPWNGFTFYDLIFPLFIFIAGVSMPFSFSNQLGKAGTNKAIAKKNIYRSLIKRTIILLLLGMIVNGALQFQGYENTRFASVLGRIALSCFFAAIIYLNCSLQKQLIWFGILLFGYWAAMTLIPVPGFGEGVLTAEGNLSAYVDRVLLPGKLHRTVYDPEGLLSTIPAIGTALLGVFTGQLIRSEKFVPAKKTLLLAASGILLILAGLLWGITFPINKNIWTSSFVLYAGGWSMMLLVAFYYIIDVAGFKKWSMPFVWMGCNAILIYMAAHGIINFESTSEFLFSGLYTKTPGIWHSVFLWTGVVLIQFSVLYFLYKKKLFLKI